MMLRLYRNGAEVDVVPCRGIASQPLPKGLGIGCETDEAGIGLYTKMPCFWNGCLDEVAVFNHAITAEQVWQLYAGSATAARPITVKPAANNQPSGSETSEEEKGGNGKQ